MSAYSAAEPIAGEHQTEEFDCGSRAQIDWLRKHAFQAHRAGTSRVYVVSRVRTRRVVGYHALAAGSVERELAPQRVQRGTGQHPTPVILRSRLGVDLSERGRGLGQALVKDALQQAAAAGHEVGVRAVLIHAESERAREFYLHLAEFEPSPTDPLHLFLLMKDLRATIGSDTR
ncbi:MAG: GNAT family N-acetyltransferase [Candidatus Limnocylindria bacterium]